MSVQVIGWMGAFMCLLTACKLEREKASAIQAPNVLLIYVDDLNNRLGYYGDTIAITPHIDKLADNGVAFLNSYSQQPLCNPSRSSMLSGMRPSSLGINSLGQNLRASFPDIVTLPQAFREAGYFTARAGKVFHQGVPDAIAWQSAGADDPKAWDKAIDVPGFELNSNGHYYNATPWRKHPSGAGGAVAWLWAEKSDDRQHDYNVATTIIELMKEERTAPFFLAAGFIRPHVPLVAPKRFFELYDEIEIPLPPSVPDDRLDMPAEAYHSWAANFDISEEDTREAIRAYYACISFVDEQVGRLLNALEEKGLADDTIVVFVSDHGYQLGAHGLWFKNYLFHESVVAPLIIKVPHGMPSRKEKRVVELLDVYPTLMSLAGIKPPSHLEGQSLLPLMRGEPMDWKDFGLIESKRGGKAIYTQAWSFMDWGGEDYELYDLQNDPFQFHNVAAQKQQIVSQLKELLNQVQHEK